MVIRFLHRQVAWKSKQQGGRQSSPFSSHWYSLVAFLIIFFTACNKNMPDKGANTAPY
jgi:hypothetical protein